jgi:hypothetical protein
MKTAPFHHALADSDRRSIREKSASAALPKIDLTYPG